jgi:hypothetical protein
MSYTPTEWQPDDIVTAARMNSLETAVGEMNMSYTPHTWVNDEVITAAKMNALEQAVAEGGGGSSDFSTATVTINPNNRGAELYGAYFDGNDAFTSDVLVQRADMTLTAVMYKGAMYGAIDTDRQVSVSGSITYDSEYGDIIITGDCTITLS